MKKLLLILALALPTFSQITQSIVLPATAKITGSMIPAQSGDCRQEILLQNWGTLSGTWNIVGSSNNCGLTMEFVASSNQIRMFWVQGNAGTGPCKGNYMTINLTGLPSQNLYIRQQKTVAGGSGMAALTYATEAWDALGNPVTIGGVGAGLCVFTSVVGAYSTGENLGSSSAGNAVTVAFHRQYSTLVTIGSQMPVTTPTSTTGLIFQWKFDNDLLDSSGNGYTGVASGAATSYVSTGTIQNLLFSRPQFSPTSFSDWISMDTGVSNAMTGLASFSQANASSVVSSYAWSQDTSSSGCTGGESLSITGSTTASPSVTPTVFGALCFTLLVTDANSNTATSTLKLGAVDQDSNGVVTHSENTKITDIFGTQIAFGKNPWAWEDERNLYMIGAQTTYQPIHNDFGWDTTDFPVNGTISYPYSGYGPGPGPACTTINMVGGLTISGLSITVTDGSLACLGLTTLPSWIMVGTGTTSVEFIRICAHPSTNVLTVCYDGRGLPGGTNQVGGSAFALGPTPWATGTEVGSLRIDGTGTKFSTDTNRPVCPGGVPGPQGQIVYSTGTVTLAPSSTTITATPATGIAWGVGTGVVKIGGFIRMVATHGGVSFVFWRRIANVSNTSLTISVAAPADIDGTAFSYNILAPSIAFGNANSGMNLALQAQKNGDTFWALFNGMGCESETVMFAIPSHDTTGINSTVMPVSGSIKYSYKSFLSEITDSGTNDPNFYGVGLAARNFYYRSGYGPALVLANSIDEYWTRDPQIADGYAGSGQPLSKGGGVIGAMADLVLNASTVLTWPNVLAFADAGMLGATTCSQNDLRTVGYEVSWLTFAANWYSSPATYKTALTAMLTRDQTCKRNSGADGWTGSEVNSFGDASYYNTLAQSTGHTQTTQPLTLTNLDTAVTGPSTTLAAAITTPSATSITVTSAASYPAVPFYITIDSEILNVTNKNGGATWTVTRGYLSSTAATHSSGASLGWFLNNGTAGGPYCYGVDSLTLAVTHGSNIATVASGSLTQQTMIWFHDGTNTGTYEYTVSGANVILSGNWFGTSGTYSAMSTGGGQINSGGQQIGGYSGILALVTPGAASDWPTLSTADALTQARGLENSWPCKFNSSTSLTLFRTWDGTSTSALTGGKQYYISYYNTPSFGTQPFFMGVKTNQMNWASKSDDSTIANGYAAILPLVGEWYNSYGWDYNNANLGTFYFTTAKACGSPADVPAGNFGSIHGFQGCGPMGLASTSAPTARVNSAEGGAAMLQYYLANPTPARKAVVDTFYGAMWGNTSYCAASVSAYCGPVVADLLANANLGATKWPGFYFGMGGFFSNVWPAMRMVNVGTAPTITTTCPLPAGIRTAAYTQTLTATGDVPFTWTISSGSLPTGLSLVGAVISGTPTVSGVATFGIQVSNAIGNSTNGPISCNITINDPPSTGGNTTGGLGVFGGIQQSK